MINEVNNFSDYRIFGQEYGMCGQACVIVAYAILNNLKLDRNEFLKLENQINEIVLKDKRRPLSHSDFISIAELFNMSYLEESLLDLKNKNSNSLFITRLKWREFNFLLSDNVYYDDEHYVLIYKIENNIVYFWEPSFSWNCKPIDPNLHRTIEDCIGGGSPFWKMYFDEFIERNQKSNPELGFTSKLITISKHY